MNNEPKILIVEDDEIKKSIYAAYFKRYCCSINLVLTSLGIRGVRASIHA